MVLGYTGLLQLAWWLVLAALRGVTWSLRAASLPQTHKETTVLFLTSDPSAEILSAFFQSLPCRSSICSSPATAPRLAAVFVAEMLASSLGYAKLRRPSSQLQLQA